MFRHGGWWIRFDEWTFAILKIQVIAGTVMPSRVLAAQLCLVKPAHRQLESQLTGSNYVLQ